MYKRTRTGLPASIAAALITAFCCGVVISGTGQALAAEYYSPPPMPEAMIRTEDAPVPAVPHNAIPVGTGRSAYINGEKVAVREAYNNDAGFSVPDTDGGFVWIPAPTRGIAPGQTDARELKLKIRELAEQLIANMTPGSAGTVLMPTSFVNQEDFSQSSPLGRFIAEQMLYECNQRNFPVREYRLAPAVTIREDGEFLLSRSPKNIPVTKNGTLFVVGTYFIDRQAVFVNARLVRGDGTILRTGQVILAGTGMARRMLAGAGSGKALKTGTLPVRDFKTVTQPTHLTPFDQGADLH